MTKIWKKRMKIRKGRMRFGKRRIHEIHIFEQVLRSWRKGMRKLLHLEIPPQGWKMMMW